MAKIKLTVTGSACRSGYHKAGDEFVFDDLCPPLCAELWQAAYPYVFALQSGGTLDCGDAKGACFNVACPDGGRVRLHGERIDDQ